MGSPQMSALPDIGIIGQGLAGSLLAWQLVRAGVNVHVWHEDLPGAASAVSPGLMTPLTGRKFTPIQNARALWAATRSVCAELESVSGRRFLHSLPVVRFFSTPEHSALAGQHSAEALACGIGSAEVLESGAHGALWQDSHGSVRMYGGGFLDLQAVCAYIREFLQAAGRLTVANVQPAAIRSLCGKVVDCRGWRLGLDPLWQHIEHNPARGELIEIETAEGALDPGTVWHFSHWLQPVSANRWRMGSTYAWSHFDAPPTISARTTLEWSLRRNWRGGFRVVDCYSGVRPAIRDYLPVLGSHPRHPEYAICYGFGSHGALYAPACAQWMAAHLLEDLPVPEAYDNRRFADK